MLDYESFLATLHLGAPVSALELLEALVLTLLHLNQAVNLPSLLLQNRKCLLLLKVRQRLSLFVRWARETGGDLGCKLLNVFLTACHGLRLEVRKVHIERFAGHPLRVAVVMKPRAGKSLDPSKIGEILNRFFGGCRVFIDNMRL